MPYMIDWSEVFRPAAWAMLNGQSPYLVEGYMNPPWAALMLAPIAVLPEAIGRTAFAIVSLVAWLWIGYRLYADRRALVLSLFSPMLINGLFYGNIDWLAALGFVMPPPAGLLFAAIKPQIGAGYLVWCAIEAWRIGRWRTVAAWFGPLLVALGVSVAIYGAWPATWVYAMEQDQSSVDLIGATRMPLWPYLLPVGLTMIAQAIRSRESRWAMAAGLCLSPHVVSYSLQAPLMLLTRSFALTLAAVAGSWLAVIILVLSR